MRKEISNLSKGILFMSLWIFSLSIFAQNITVKGLVTDATNEPLIGVTIKVQGTTMGTVTDVDGNYTLLNISPNATLEVSYVGMSPQNISVSGRTTIDIVLLDDSAVLDEVVVVGYGVQKKESLIGSIVQTSSEDIKRTGGVTDLRQALTGQLPGVVTMTATGEPGGAGRDNAATDIYIRGKNTWNGGQPLVLVDGVERSMENIDVNEVETISVLKDASATAVFGVKGANGVILITTKRGRSGKPEMTVNYNSTALMVSRLPQKLGSYDTRRLQNEIIEREVGLSPGSWVDYTPIEILERYRSNNPEYAEIYPDVNWSDALFKDVSMSHRASFNLRGGTDFVTYFGSAAYLREGDMFRRYDNDKGYEPNFDFDRFNFRTNLGFNLTNTTKLKVDLSGYYSIKNTNYEYFQVTSGSSNNPSVWAAAYSMPPDSYLPKYSDGYWGAQKGAQGSQRVNPIAALYHTGLMTYKTTSMNSNFSLQQKLDFITKGLSTEGSFFYDTSVQTSMLLNDMENARRDDGNYASKSIDPLLYKGPDQDPSEYTEYYPVSKDLFYDWIERPWTLRAEEMDNDRISRRMMYQLQMNYARKFGLHNVGALGLFKREEYARGSMFKNYREDWVFRTTYDYDGRYLFEANGAYNGSEKFGPGYRFEFFPSLALGYYVTNEKFWKVDFMNRLKLKYSIGWVGDDQGGARWAYANQYSFGGASLMDPILWNTNSIYTWYKQSRIGNPFIRWETAKKQNVGAEMGFFRDMISVNLDYFTEHRTDILVDNRRDIPDYFGAAAPASNTGEVKARGYEIEAKFNHKIDNVFLWSNFSMTHTRNKVIFRDDPELLPSYQKQEGYSIGQQRWMIKDRFYNNWDDIYASTPVEIEDDQKLPGYYHIVDFNGDGLISINGDTAPVGSPDTPLNTYNFSVGAEYKNISLMLQFYGVNNVSLYLPQSDFGNASLSHGYKGTAEISNLNVLFEHTLDHWTKENQDASSFLPRWRSRGQFIGDYFLFDGSYVRLKTAELAYKFDKKLLSQVGVSGLRVFINGNNLLFWSKLPDDRESYSHGSTDSKNGAYPTPRRINCGFELTF